MRASVAVGSDTTVERLRLYRRAARALNRFFADWTGAFCSCCLEVTARACPGDPRAGGKLLVGRFPGCCHAGVGDTATVPGPGTPTSLPAGLAQGLAAARRGRCGEGDGAGAFTLREPSGRVVEGRGCRYLGQGGCRAGDVKAPLCLTYVCDGVRSALAEAAGGKASGGDDDNFCGAGDALRSVASVPLDRAEAEVQRLERRLGELEGGLRRGGVPGGGALLQSWLADGSGFLRNPDPGG